MVNPIFQQDEELLLNPFGSKYLPSGTYTDVNSNQFVVQEDAVISVLTGGDASIAENNIDYKASMNLSGVTLKKGALIVAPVREAFKSITIDSGAIMAYNCVVKGQKTGSLLEFSPYNIWDSEHITIDGTTTTLHDFNTFGDKIDMSNPSASNQPTYNASSANFGSKPSLSFDGVSQYLKADAVGYGSDIDTGVIISVTKDSASVANLSMYISDSNQSVKYFNSRVNRDNNLRLIVASDIIFAFKGNTDISDFNASVKSIGMSNSTWKMWINQIAQVITFTNGTPPSLSYLSSYPNFNTISLGGLVRSTGVDFSDGEWVFTGVFPYVSDAQVVEIVNFLKNKYGVA